GVFWWGRLKERPPGTDKEPVPVPEVDWLPPGGSKADGAEIKEVDGKKLYTRILVTKNWLEIPFRLIPSERPSDPATFYMMENKVAVRLFEVAVADPAFNERLNELIRPPYQWVVANEWRLGGSAGKEKPRLGIENKDWPVLRVTVTEAYCFARWL